MCKFSDEISSHKQWSLAKSFKANVVWYETRVHPTL